MLPFLVGFNCLMHTVDHFGNEGNSAATRWQFKCVVLCVRWQSDIQCLSELDTISGFSVSQGSAEPLDRWGGKTKHHLISYFLGNTSAKIMYVKIIASQRWDVFWDTVCSLFWSTTPSLQYLSMIVHCVKTFDSWQNPSSYSWASVKSNTLL